MDIAEHARFGLFLRKVREGEKVSQRELAKRLQLKQSFVSKIERGERQLHVLEFLAVCDQLGVSPAEVITQFQREQKAVTPPESAE